MKPSNQQEYIIRPQRFATLDWGELFAFRELFFCLSWRDVLVRYKQTVFGVLWALIRPILTMIVFTIVFGKIAGLSSEGGGPYALMVFAALLPWQFFATGVQQCSESLLNNSSLLSKIYFPRIIIPISSIITACIDLLLSLVLYFVLMAWYGVSPSINLLFLPFLIVLASLNILGIGLLVSALNVSYRDFRYIIPFVIQFGMYISPVGFSSSVIPEKWRLLYSLNPMVGVIDGFRWCLLGKETALYMPGFLASLVLTLLMLLLGFVTFSRMGRTFADKI